MPDSVFPVVAAPDIGARAETGVVELNVFLVILGGLVLLFTRGFDQVWPIASLVIVASTIVFGLTARPFTKIYARYRAQEEGG